MESKVKVDCPHCRATGLYCGFAEPKGTAVVCRGCDGKGWVMNTIRPFAGRKRREGINTIRYSAGTFIATGVGPVGKAMSYEEFEKACPEGE